MTTTIIACTICLLVGVWLGVSFSNAKESELQDLKAQLAASKPKRGAGGKFVSKGA